MFAAPVTLKPPDVIPPPTLKLSTTPTPPVTTSAPVVVEVDVVVLVRVRIPEEFIAPVIFADPSILTALALMVCDDTLVFACSVSTIRF
jgi:hypothetical protein